MIKKRVTRRQVGTRSTRVVVISLVTLMTTGAVCIFGAACGAPSPTLREPLMPGSASIRPSPVRAEEVPRDSAPAASSSSEQEKL